MSMLCGMPTIARGRPLISCYINQCSAEQIIFLSFEVDLYIPESKIVKRPKIYHGKGPA
jgi:hypothetical protein